MIPRRALVALLAAGALGGAATARAAAPGDDAIDDPKLARRLGARTTLAPPSGELAAPVAVVTPPSVSGPAPAPFPPAGGDDRRLGLGNVDAGLVGERPAVSEHGSAKTPMLGLGYRRFNFVQVGATDPGSATGAAAKEAFSSVSLDFYPISRLVRWGLSTQYGWQEGRFNSGNGDYFIAQSSSLGLQLAGPTLTPFVEGFAGVGYMRRFQFEQTIPTIYWQFGVDAGANIFLGEHGFFSVALGYLRPVNGFLKGPSPTSVFVDTWSFKVGFGI